MTAKTARDTRKKSVPFAVKTAEAAEVRVTGEFTGWTPEGLRLDPSGDGTWKTTLKLVPGEYQYRLLIDGAWWNNPEAPRRVANPFGSENDVLVVS